MKYEVCINFSFRMGILTHARLIMKFENNAYNIGWEDLAESSLPNGIGVKSNTGVLERAVLFTKELEDL